MAGPICAAVSGPSTATRVVNPSAAPDGCPRRDSVLLSFDAVAPLFARADARSRCGESDDCDADGSEPEDPSGPDGSANATGIAAMAEPMPSATASAPTRPM